MRRTAVGLLAVAAVLLTGCSGDNGDNGDNGDGGANGERTEDKASGPLAGLDGDKLCAMVDRATIEEQFHEPIRDTLGGVNPPEQRGSVVCDYVTESLLESDVEDIDEALSISVKVTDVSDKATTVEEALDAYLVDSDGKTVDYERVDGLGDAAGYAGSELGVRLDENQLVAILEVDGAFIEVVASSEPVGTLDQLRPIADELVKGVESELR